MTLVRCFALLFILFTLNGCEAIWLFSSMASSSARKPIELKVASVSHPLVFHRETSFGLEKELLEQFAQEQGYILNWSFYKNSEQAIQAVQEGRADIAAARINLDRAYGRNLLLSPSYEESPVLLICPKQKKQRKKTPNLIERLFAEDEDFPENIKVLATNLVELKGDWSKKFVKNYPEKELVSLPKKSGKDLLKMISKTRHSCAALERTEAQYFLRFFPSLKVIRELHPTLSIGFLISPKHLEVQRTMLGWFQRTSRTMDIAKTKDRHLGHLDHLDEMDLIRFFKMVNQNLKELIPHFKRVAQEFGIPWQLIAAVAYQESHWNNDAISYTGVRGIMMLTEETALHLGIEDRTNLEQSIYGGAKYLRQLIDSQPKTLALKDRIILTLIAYNVGPAHLLDAQRLAVKLGKNPYSWKDLKKTLPLLADPDYLADLTYGQARGHEPVEFTNRTLGFYDLLVTRL